MENQFLQLAGAWSLLAQEGTPDTPSFMATTLPLFVMLGVLFFLMVIRPESRRRKEHQSMLDSLKKNDRVIFAGGIHGTVVNVQKGQPDVTLRVDDSSSTRMRVLRQAISKVVTGDGEDAADSS